MGNATKPLLHVTVDRRCGEVSPFECVEGTKEEADGGMTGQPILCLNHPFPQTMTGKRLEQTLTFSHPNDDGQHVTWTVLTKAGPGPTAPLN